MWLRGGGGRGGGTSGGATNTATQADDVGTAGAAMGAHVAALGAYSVLLGGRVRDAVLRIAARVQETRHCTDGDAAVSAVRGVWRDFASGALTRLDAWEGGLTVLATARLRVPAGGAAEAEERVAVPIRGLGGVLLRKPKKSQPAARSPRRGFFRFVRSVTHRQNRPTGARARQRAGNFLIKMSGRCDPDFPAASAALFRFSLSVRKIYLCADLYMPESK